MQEMIVSKVLESLLTYGLPVLIGALVVWLQGRSAREQRWAALAGQVAKEAVMLSEKSGLKGADKFEKAVDLFNLRMASAGKTVVPAVAIAQVQAAHNELTLDKTTAYNEKPTTLDTASEAMGTTAVYGK